LESIREEATPGGRGRLLRGTPSTELGGASVLEGCETDVDGYNGADLNVEPAGIGIPVGIAVGGEGNSRNSREEVVERGGMAAADVVYSG